MSVSINDAGVIEGYNPETGDRLWKKSTHISMNSHHSLPATDSVVVVPTDSGLSAVSESGETVWSDDVPLSGDTMSTEDIFFIPKYDGVEARTFDGGQKWIWESESPVHYLGGDNNTIFTKADTSIYAINVADGTTRWSFRTTMEPSVPPIVKDGLLLIGRDDGHLTAIRRDTQEEVWSVNLSNRIATPVTAGESNIYAAGWSYPLHAINPEDGRTQWSFDPEYQTVSPAVESNETVYVSSDTGVLFARSRADGHPEWSFELGSASMAPPLIQESQMYVTSDDGGVYCLTLPD